MLVTAFLVLVLGLYSCEGLEYEGYEDDYGNYLEDSTLTLSNNRRGRRFEERTSQALTPAGLDYFQEALQEIMPGRRIDTLLPELLTKEADRIPTDFTLMTPMYQYEEDTPAGTADIRQDIVNAAEGETIVSFPTVPLVVVPVRSKPWPVRTSRAPERSSTALIHSPERSSTYGSGMRYYVLTKYTDVQVGATLSLPNTLQAYEEGYPVRAVSYKALSMSSEEEIRDFTSTEADLSVQGKDDKRQGNQRSQDGHYLREGDQVQPTNDDSTGNGTDYTETGTDAYEEETLPICRTTTKSTTTTTTTTTTPPRFDIAAFLEIIANLTYDYETNLTRQVNETLQKYKVPTCPTPTSLAPRIATTPTTTTTTTESSGKQDYPGGLNRTIIAKCFVCGLDIPGIPMEASCADAFAGDFLPLVPQDPRAKGMITRFRKYCRYGEVHNYHLNASQPRTIYGRWTGGCSVRWTDVTGVYTQRSCRNRRRAVTGLHYGSKRMAKLEMALSSLDTGCIVSPVATLLPLSRGVSLFARFHACVCVGNWCNRAPRGGRGGAGGALPLWLAGLVAVLL